MYEATFLLMEVMVKTIDSQNVHRYNSMPRNLEFAGIRLDDRVDHACQYSKFIIICEDVQSSRS